MSKPDELQPRFPLYVVSKGRDQYMMTSKALTKMGVQHHVIVEPQEVDAYTAAIERMGLSCEVLSLDLAYKRNYQLCDTLGLSRSTGPGPARNFAWDHSVAHGHAWHWVMDDNLRGFFRLQDNQKIPTTAPAYWRVMEDFALRYKNVGMAGPNYCMFAKRKQKIPPFITNTRIYSCNLIRNDVPFRWRGRYNEDTILSLDLLKAKWCTVQFNAMLQHKMGTQVLKGGNTAEFYHAEGTVPEGQRYADTGTVAKSLMLAHVHPDVATMVYRFSRWHHHVDYRPFKGMPLVYRDGYAAPAPGVNDYGMQLVYRNAQGATP